MPSATATATATTRPEMFNSIFPPAAACKYATSARQSWEFGAVIEYRARLCLSFPLFLFFLLARLCVFFFYLPCPLAVWSLFTLSLSGTVSTHLLTHLVTYYYPCPCAPAPYGYCHHSLTPHVRVRVRVPVCMCVCVTIKTNMAFNYALHATIESTKFALFALNFFMDPIFPHPQFPARSVYSATIFRGLSIFQAETCYCI